MSVIFGLAGAHTLVVERSSGNESGTTRFGGDLYRQMLGKSDNAELPETYSEERSKAFFALWMRIASREGHCAECLPVGSKSSTVKPVDARSSA